jgi:hypothetical protein
VTIDPAGRSLLPVACTLGVEDGAQRLEDWRRLFATAGIGRELTSSEHELGVHITGDPEELRALALAGYSAGA